LRRGGPEGAPERPIGVAFSVAYLLTGSIAVATGVGLIEPLVNTVVFHLHERAWRRVEQRGQPRSHSRARAADRTTPLQRRALRG